jgi:hypothetical protein
VALRASSSDWPSSSAETSKGAAGGGPDAGHRPLGGCGANRPHQRHLHVRQSRCPDRKPKGSFLPSPDSSGYAVEVFFDDEVHQSWSEVDELNIIGTGCLSKEDAERYA